MIRSGSKNKAVKLIIQRYDPERDEAPHLQEFDVPKAHGTTVLDAMFFVKQNLDSSLAFRSSCRMAICGSCGVMVNGYPRLACHTQIEELRSESIEIRPLPNFNIIKDLVPDVLPYFLKMHRLIKPFVIRSDSHEIENPSRDFLQSEEELKSYLQFSYCVKCGICVSACPTSATDRLFLGPQALAQCHRYCADSRDDGAGERLGAVRSEHGAWHCHLAGSCSESCPKGVDPALGIQLLKRRLAANALNLCKKQAPAELAPLAKEEKPRVPVPTFTAQGK